MLKLISLFATFALCSQTWAASVHLNPGEKYRVNKSTTVYCDGEQQVESRWRCTCYIGFANMGAVYVYADTARKADQLGLPKCQAERAADVNAVQCFREEN